jgi:small-conductance mechanosensitive channel
MDLSHYFSAKSVVQIIITLAVLLFAILIHVISRLAISKYARRKSIKDTRSLLIRKLFRWTIIFVALFAIISVWGIDIKNAWMFITGIIGVLAIGFVAVWSMLSNILAGLLLFMSDAFRIDDEIVVLPEGIEGRVVDLKLLFVVLKDRENNIIHIPNNFLFQKVIKKLNR